MDSEYIAPENTEETEAITQSGTDYLEIAQNFLIQSEKDYINADTFNDQGREQIKKIEAHCDPRIKQAHGLHKALCDDKNKFLDPIKEARGIIGGKMSTYKQAQIRKRMEEEAKQREILRKQEEERKKAEDDKRLAEAIALDKQGRHEESEAVMNAPAIEENKPIPAPISVPAVPKTKTRYRTGYKVEVVDKDKVPREFMDVNEQRVKQRVKSFDGKIEIPGIVIKVTQTPY